MPESYHTTHMDPDLEICCSIQNLAVVLLYFDKSSMLLDTRVRQSLLFCRQFQNTQYNIAKNFSFASPIGVFPICDTVAEKCAKMVKSKTQWKLFACSVRGVRTSHDRIRCPPRFSKSTTEHHFKCEVANWSRVHPPTQSSAKPFDAPV